MSAKCDPGPPGKRLTRLADALRATGIRPILLKEALMSQLSNTPYEALEVGQKAEYTKLVEERDIQLFAAMSGDHNPVHLDAEFAAKSMFRERIAHGMFSGALISAAVACTLPGPGTIYLGQQMSFQKPVKIGDTLTVRLEILEKLPKFKVRIATNVYNQNDELVVAGEAEILAPRKQQTVELVSPPNFVAS